MLGAFTTHRNELASDSTNRNLHYSIVCTARSRAHTQRAAPAHATPPHTNPAYSTQDTEGYESFVVRGSKNSILGKVPYMVLEFFSYHDRRDELAEMLTTAGYLMSTQAFHGPIWPKDQYHQDPPNFDVYAWLPDW